VVAALGVVLVVRKTQARTGLALLGLGLGGTLAGAMVMRGYNGAALPFDVRYAATVGSGFGGILAGLSRPSVLGYASTLGLSGGWLALTSPLALVPAVPSLAWNTLSSSAWMVSGKAHYSALVLPFIVLGAADGLRRMRHSRRLLGIGCSALLVTGAAGYAFEGAGPLGGNFAPARVTEHALRAAALADRLPKEAAISASSALVPRVSRRPRVYVFPAMLDAEYVFLDLRSSPSPTSAGDVFLRTAAMLHDGGWQVEHAQDGLVVMHRVDDAPPTDIRELVGVFGSSGESITYAPTTDAAAPLGAFLDGRVSLLSAEVLNDADGSIDVDGPRGTLRTMWRTSGQLPSGTQLEFWLDLRDGQRLHAWDIAALWWNPPDGWTPGQAVIVDVPDVPIRQFQSWRAGWSVP
jgi:hypothetical protein